jgi:hypothetical protein
MDWNRIAQMTNQEKKCSSPGGRCAQSIRGNTGNTEQGGGKNNIVVSLLVGDSFLLVLYGLGRSSFCCFFFRPVRCPQSQQKSSRSLLPDICAVGFLWILVEVREELDQPAIAARNAFQFRRGPRAESEISQPATTASFRSSCAFPLSLSLSLSLSLFPSCF